MLGPGQALQIGDMMSRETFTLRWGILGFFRAFSLTDLDSHRMDCLRVLQGVHFGRREKLKTRIFF